MKGRFQLAQTKEGKPGEVITLCTRWTEAQYLGITLEEVQALAIPRRMVFDVGTPESCNHGQPPPLFCVTGPEPMPVRLLWGQMVDPDHLIKVQYSHRKTQHKPRDAATRVWVETERVVVQADGQWWLFWRLSPQHPLGIPSPELAQVKDPRDVIADCCRLVMSRHLLTQKS